LESNFKWFQNKLRSPYLDKEQPEDIREEIIKVQKEIDEIQQIAPMKEVEYAKTIIPVPNKLKERIKNSALIEEDEGILLKYYNTLLLIDSGSNANCISKKLAKLLECPIYKTKNNPQVSAGKAELKEGTTLSLAVWMKQETDSYNKKLMLMHNISFVIVPSPDYMLAIGKNMERDYITFQSTIYIYLSIYIYIIYIYIYISKR